MSELRAVRRIRPEVEPLDDASFERIWNNITGTRSDSRDFVRSAEVHDASTFDLDATPSAPRPRWVLTAAAAALVVVGVGAVAGLRTTTDEPNPSAPAAQPTDSTVDESEPLPPAAADEKVLLLPAESVEPTYVQHDAALPHRTRGLVSAPDGSTLSINVFENFWGELPGDMEQRTIGGLTWATTVEDTNRGYVSLDVCTMLSVNAGPDGPAWDPDAVSLIESVQFADPIAIALPGGWQLIEVGAVGEWYSMSFDTEFEGTPGVTLTQMPGSNAGPLLADLAGRPIVAVTIDGGPGWQVALDEEGWTQTIWQNDRGAMKLTSKGLGTDQIDEFLTQLSPATASDWDARYSDQDAGANSFMPDPGCEPASLSINSPGT